ncbi:MAG: DUF7453 family protein [Micromonosporaceae bacterium]
MKRSLLGTHSWYQQTHRGLDVLGGVRALHSYHDGARTVTDERKPIIGAPPVIPTVARARALSAGGPHAQLADLAILPGTPARLVWAVDSRPRTGATRTLVDAHTGAVISVESLARHVDGEGRVFDPNPVVTLRDPSLRDQDDADYPELAPAYRTVPLRHLDGSGFLRGRYAEVLAPDEAAYAPDNVFDYPRSSTFFSQTMAYYHLTKAQEYIASLGFTDVNHEPQLIVPDGLEEDSSFYQPGSGTDPDLIVTGTGGVDDAEDADVMWHEYGHAIQDDQVPGWGTSEDARAIGEGFGDYWGVTMSQPVNDGYDVPCMADWDAAGFGCLRRVDTDLTVADRTFREHDDGRIWSRALWDINQALGRDVANLIILEAQFGYSPATTFDAAARVTVDTALQLLGGRAARIAYQAFRARGMLASLPDTAGSPGAPPSSPGLHPIARLNDPAPGGGFHVTDFEPYDLNDHGQALFGSDVTTGGEALLLGGSGDLVEMARAFRPAPGGGVYGFGVFPGTTTLNASGEAAYAFVGEPLLLPNGRNARVYRWQRGTATAVLVPDVTPAPTGGSFAGVAGAPSINDRGTVAFAGMIPTEHGIEGDLGVGVFTAAASGTIGAVVVPGDPAPGGGRFDFADQPTVNASGDLAFGGHVAGTPCTLSVPQDIVIGCARDLYLRPAASGQVRRVVALGDAAPGGGVFRSVLFPVINGAGDVLFRAVLETDGGLERGLFLARGAELVAVARIGQPAPGGGRLLQLASQPGNWDLNDRGDATFSATLDTADNPEGLPDQGLYRWTDGQLSLVVRSGTPLAGGAEIVVLQPPEFIGSLSPFSGALINNARQVLFAALVRVGDFYDTVLYIATGDDLTRTRAVSSVGDFVWNDLDRDGIQDPGEPGVPDARVELLAPGGGLLSATVTDHVGRYGFGDLPPGDYTLRFRPPRGFTLTAPDRGADDADSDADPATGRTGTVTLLPRQDDITVDAGLRRVPRASIGGSVWLDSDADGVQDKGEPTVGDVSVTLLDADGNVLGTQLTHAQFGYIFPQLPAGDYRIRFTTPQGYAFTTPNIGNDDTVDSDADPVTGLTPVITLPDGRIDLSVDAGLVPI